MALHTYLGKTTVTNDGPRVEGSTSAAGCATPVAEWSSRRVPFLMIKAMHENENTSASILVKRSKWMLFFLSSVQSSDAWTADEFDRRFRTPVCIFQRFPLTLSGSFYGRSGRRMRRMLGIVQRPLPPRAQPTRDHGQTFVKDLKDARRHLGHLRSSPRPKVFAAHEAGGRTGGRVDGPLSFSLDVPHGARPAPRLHRRGRANEMKADKQTLLDGWTPLDYDGPADDWATGRRRSGGALADLARLKDEGIRRRDMRERLAAFACK